MNIPSGGSDSFIDDVMGGLYPELKPCARCKKAPRMEGKAYCHPCKNLTEIDRARTRYSMPKMADFYRPKTKEKV